MNTDITNKTAFEAEYLEPGKIYKRSSLAGQKMSKVRNCLNPAKEYANATSIHGIKYIAEDDRHPIERCS